MARKRTGRRSRSATRGARRATRGARRARARTSRQERRGSKPERRSRSKKKSRRGSKKLNPYMRALKQARDNDEESFTYNGKTYRRKYAKTGMAIYKAA